MNILPTDMEDIQKQNELVQQISKLILNNHLSLAETLGVFNDVCNKLAYDCSLSSKD